MYIQILTLSVEELPSEHCEALRDECTATCDHLTGVVAHRWSVNRRTDTLNGMVKWTDEDALSKGTAALATATAILHPERLVPTHREIECPVQPRPVRNQEDGKPKPDTMWNTGFVTYPEDYDHRG